MDINEYISARLSYKDVALIAVALGMYNDKIKDNGDKHDEEMVKHTTQLINRLGESMYNVAHGTDCPNCNNENTNYVGYGWRSCSNCNQEWICKEV